MTTRTSIPKALIQAQHLKKVVSSLQTINECEKEKFEIRKLLIDSNARRYTQKRQFADRIALELRQDLVDEERLDSQESELHEMERRAKRAKREESLAKRRARIEGRTLYLCPPSPSVSIASSSSSSSCPPSSRSESSGPIPGAPPAAPSSVPSKPAVPHLRDLHISHPLAPAASSASVPDAFVVPHPVPHPHPPPPGMAAPASNQSILQPDSDSDVEMADCSEK